MPKMRGLLRPGGSLRGAGLMLRAASGMLRKAVGSMLRHDGLNLAQSAAYSAIVALFPALVVSAAAIALLPDVAPLKVQVGAFFDEVLPSDVFPLLTSYFAGPSVGAHTGRTLVIAGIVSITGSSSVLVTLMEGLRRAANLPRDCWTFWERRARSLVLVPLCLLPLGIATVAVMFGQALTVWLVEYLAKAVQPAFFAVALAVRWTIALAGVVWLTEFIYRLGTPRRQSWRATLPGAVVATGLWFVTTLGFGWYVTRYANYSQVYGPLGAGIALLIWLYLVFLSVLCGAEFNAIYGRAGSWAETGNGQSQN